MFNLEFLCDDYVIHVSLFIVKLRIYIYIYIYILFTKDAK
jgi:hypothetical protein